MQIQHINNFQPLLKNLTPSAQEPPSYHILRPTHGFKRPNIFQYLQTIIIRSRPNPTTANGTILKESDFTAQITAEQGILNMRFILRKIGGLNNLNNMGTIVAYDVVRVKSNEELSWYLCSIEINHSNNHLACIHLLQQRRPKWLEWRWRAGLGRAF